MKIDDILFNKHFHCESSLDMVVTYEDAKASMNEFAIQCLNEVKEEFANKTFLVIYLESKIKQLNNDKETA